MSFPTTTLRIFSLAGSNIEVSIMIARSVLKDPLSSEILYKETQTSIPWDKIRISIWWVSPAIIIPLYNTFMSTCWFNFIKVTF